MTVIWVNYNIPVLCDHDFKTIGKNRAQMSVCPSARPNVNISKLLEKIIDKEVYKTDYKEITTYFQNKPIDYDAVINVLRVIIESDIF